MGGGVFKLPALNHGDGGGVFKLPALNHGVDFVLNNKRSNLPPVIV